MNRSKRAMPAKTRKKMQKELRSAAPKSEPILKSNDIKAQQLLSTLPPKTRKKETAVLKSLEKTMAVKKAKKASHTSKRTTPGKVKKQSAPRSPHIEGARWIQTTGKQAATKRKVMTRQMNKQMTKKGSK